MDVTGDSTSENAMDDLQGEIYKKKFELLLKRCREIEQDNQRIAYRIYKVEKMYKETRHDKKILKQRLDLHRDEWRAAYAERNSADAPEGLLPPPQSNLVPHPPAPPQKPVKLKISLGKSPQASSSKAPVKQPAASSSRAAPKPQNPSKAHGGKPKAVMPIKQPVNRSALNSPASKSSLGGKPQSLIRPPLPLQAQPPASKAPNRRASIEKGGKKASKERPKKPKVEKDPNAPKKPANPFLQFCKEQRLITTELMRGASDINKQELNKVLCNRWKTLTPEDKKVYIEKYELEKQQYSIEMELYGRQKEGMLGSLPAELFDLP
ncbi:uncharacterized protein LOC132194610 [Neocloeon triangulifer]|uniref:uncharacterized protein LOC132194610 n=1 Tax=Neocloeon triangulifer TaxID=2078957 RepID=UPI00286FA479|nr:uncharacterized protein LOC132194610 [Neocloeon triangulifer]